MGVKCSECPYGSFGNCPAVVQRLLQGDWEKIRLAIACASQFGGWERVMTGGTNTFNFKSPDLQKTIEILREKKLL